MSACIHIILFPPPIPLKDGLAFISNNSGLELASKCIPVDYWHHLKAKNKDQENILNLIYFYIA